MAACFRPRCRFALVADFQRRTNSSLRWSVPHKRRHLGIPCTWDGLPARLSLERDEFEITLEFRVRGPLRALFSSPRDFYMIRPLSFLAMAAAMFALSSTSSLADRAKADACAAGLSPDAKLIYSSIIGKMAPGVDLVASVKSQARSLVMDGKLERAQAQSAAQSAGACLKQAL
jgi:hypothetical protein